MLGGMARPAFTLAALATAALPGLEVASVRPRTTGQSGDFDSAEITSIDGRHLIVRVPRTQSAETDQSADLVALRALTEGVRQRLPFAVPNYVGQAPIGPTRGIVYDFIPGAQLTGEALTSDAELAASVGRAIAAIHTLPTSLVSEAGLPTVSASQARLEIVELINRAAATGHVPVALVKRWEEAVEDDRMWQFVATVINGELAPDSFLVLETRVNGLLGWSALQVGDPARDIHWLLAARGAFAELALQSYVAARGGLTEDLLPRRALLYGELELARWLLHGVDTRDAAIVDDAVALLDQLVSSVHAHAAPTITNETGPIMTMADVETLLQSTPAVDVNDRGVSLTTDSVMLGDSPQVEADEHPEHTAWKAASESLWSPPVDEADEPVAVDSSVFEGVREYDQSNPDDVTTEPLNLPRED